MRHHVPLAAAALQFPLAHPAVAAIIPGPRNADEFRAKPCRREQIMNATRFAHVSAQYELRFQSLFKEGRAFAFPCDSEGHVNIDSLSDRARSNYFYARTVIGREVSMPAVRASSLN